MVPYTAAKYAVVGMSEALSAELSASGVKVSTVCTGMVKSRPLHPTRLKFPLSRMAVLQQLHEQLARSPEKAAQHVLRAVERGRSRVVTARELAPLWWTKRLSPRLYTTFLRYVMRLIEAKTH